MDDQTPTNYAEALKTFMDEAGRITTWPTKHKKREQQLILEYLATKFDTTTQYTEKQVNELLNQYHTFDDWALLRRELFEHGFLNRAKDGAKYWRTPKTKFV